MNISFHLRPEKKSVKTGLVPIAILVTEKRISVRKNIPSVKVLEKDWDKNSQRIIPSKRNEATNNSFEFNSTLDRIVFRLNEMWTKSYLSGTPITQVSIIQVLENKTPEDPIKIDFIDCFQEFIDQNKSLKAERTIKGYTTTKNLLDDFFKQSEFPKSFEIIDLKFFDEFVKFCFDRDKPFLNNYFAKLVAHLKTFMKWANDRSYHNNLIFNRFKANEEQIEVIFLTKEELSTFYHYEFENDKHAKVRDVYCFSAFSGLRYSDLANLKSSNILPDEIRIGVKKTRQQDLIIPLHEYSKAILNKYKDTIYYPLPIISIQKLNKYLKEACEIAQINTEISIVRYSGAKAIEQTIPKWKKITIHTARKTFVCNSIMFNMDISAIKAITGHKTDRQFQRYVSITDTFKKSETQKWSSMIVKKKTN
jgi:integrase